jgi:hypothetical protein
MDVPFFSDSAKVTALAQEKRPDEDVCGLVVLDGDHLLVKKKIKRIFVTYKYL